jgi:hypothetical protein
MEYRFTNLIETIISVFFQGGIEEFMDKGSITVIPNPAKEIVIYHPDLDENVIAKLKASETKDMDSVHIMRERNFDGYESDQLREVNIKICEKVIELHPNGNVLFVDNSHLVVISLPFICDDDKVLEDIFSFLRNLNDLSLAYVISRTTAFKIEPKRAKYLPAEKHTITQDDITNLIIDIERSNSVNDLFPEGNK